ncbi:MAG: hypothetical protein IJI54_05760 [Kiritimatiellae bacterium]|nr:hypothetical protein [Kiritimatiellia bacterium]
MLNDKQRETVRDYFRGVLRHPSGRRQDAVHGEERGTGDQEGVPRVRREGGRMTEIKKEYRAFVGKEGA